MVEKTEIQTSETEEETNEETPTGKTEAEETEGKEPAPEPDYKEKFAQSTREAQRLLEEKKTLEAQSVERDRELADLREKETEKERLLEEENPDAAKMLKLEKSINEMKKDVLLGKEERDLSSFIKDNSQAEVAKEALRQLYRANPTKSLEALWNENLSPAIEAAVKAKTGKKATQSETGKGNVSGEPIAELGEEFNELPLEKRKEIFKKMGL